MNNNETESNTTMKNKILTREAMLRNIGGLSVGDRAYCGPYGTVRCTSAASDWVPNAKVPRKFSVSGNVNGVLQNRGNWTMAAIRKAIYA